MSEQGLSDREWAEAKRQVAMDQFELEIRSSYVAALTALLKFQDGREVVCDYNAAVHACVAAIHEVQP